jgi:hypothetical protein
MNDKEEHIWWGVSSCTTKMDTCLEFTGGKTSPFIRIMFQIKAKRSCSIRSLSSIPKEEEIVLPPASAFYVMSVNEVAERLWIVELEEQITSHPLIS